MSHRRDALTPSPVRMRARPPLPSLEAVGPKSTSVADAMAALNAADAKRKAKKIDTDSRIQAIYELCGGDGNASCVARAGRGEKKDLSGGTCRVDTLEAIRGHVSRINKLNKDVSRDLACARREAGNVRRMVDSMAKAEIKNHAEEARTSQGNAAALLQIQALASDLKAKVDTYNKVMVERSAWSSEMGEWEEATLSKIVASPAATC